MRGMFLIASVGMAIVLGGCTVSSSSEVSAGGKTEQNYFGMGVDPATAKPWAAAGKTVERPAEVTMRGQPVTLIGESPKVGDVAPPFVAVANDMSAWQFTGKGKVVVISAVPSLDTGTCSRETKRFNEEAEKVPGVEIVTISMDLPFAQKRWCGAEGVKNVITVSDFKDRAFAEKYGVRIKESGLLARAVWVVGKDGKIVYREICPELASEPDYARVIEAAKAAVGITGKSAMWKIPAGAVSTVK